MYPPDNQLSEREKMVRGALYLASDPGVQFLTADHSRAAGPEFARPVVVGSRAWLGGGVIVGPGATIGAGSVIGAGAWRARRACRRDGAGNPCR
jgi:maltose O-acetyltransferase